ncbi:MAG: hypothetical protein H7Y03_05150 [Chitinophagaceae bacterium]|nr:hypothetical protein [Chitinophagaceae bacterium]
MKNFYFKGISLAVITALSLSACKRDDKELQVPLTPETLAGRYLLTALTVETAVTAPTDAMSRFEPCELDDLYELNADSTANYIDAGQKCDPVKAYGFRYDMTTKTVFLVGLKEDFFPGGTVKQFDGKTIVLEGKVKNEETLNREVTVVGTLVKQ